MEGKSKSCTDSFTHKELRDLFTFDPDTACATHDLLQCPCETRKERSSEAEGSSGTAEEDEGDQGAETAQSKNGRVHKFVDMDSSDSEPDMGFVSATQVRPDKYEKAVGSTLPSSVLRLTAGLCPVPEKKERGTRRPRGMDSHQLSSCLCS